MRGVRASVSRRLGVRPGIDLDKALRLAGQLEDDETVRKLEHGAELNSCDADFSRFSGLRWTDPLRDL